MDQIAKVGSIHGGAGVVGMNWITVDGVPVNILDPNQSANNYGMWLNMADGVTNAPAASPQPLHTEAHPPQQTSVLGADSTFLSRNAEVVGNSARVNKKDESVEKEPIESVKLGLTPTVEVQPIESDLPHKRQNSYDEYSLEDRFEPQSKDPMRDYVILSEKKSHSPLIWDGQLPVHLRPTDFTSEQVEELNETIAQSILPFNLAYHFHN